MAILQIARMGHPVLRQRAEPVADPASEPNAAALGRFIADMVETLEDAGGIGLAAPQVHVPARLVIFTPPPDDAAEDSTEDAEEADGEAPGAAPLTILINPEIEPLGEDQELGWEGCLSVPGLRGLVPRHSAIRYRGLAPDGSLVERGATGYHARVVQHECDHLDGVLYPMRMPDLSQLVFESEWRHVVAAARDEAQDGGQENDRQGEGRDAQP